MPTPSSSRFRLTDGRSDAAALRARTGGRAEPALDRLSLHGRRLWRPWRDWVDGGDAAAPAQRKVRAPGRGGAGVAGLRRATGKAVQIFRLAGIYGPGQNALVNLAQGTARRIIKPGQVFNRIHVEDIAGALAASMDRPSPGAIYNVTDDEPAPPQDVVAYAAGLMGVPRRPTCLSNGAALADGRAASMARTSGSQTRRRSRGSAGCCAIRPIARRSQRCAPRATEDEASTSLRRRAASLRLRNGRYSAG